MTDAASGLLHLVGGAFSAVGHAFSSGISYGYALLAVILTLWALWHRRARAAVELIVVLVLLGVCVYHPGFYLDLLGSVVGAFTGR
jgi:hypothetical protein